MLMNAWWHKPYIGRVIGANCVEKITGSWNYDPEIMTFFITIQSRIISVFITSFLSYIYLNYIWFWRLFVCNVRNSGPEYNIRVNIEKIWKVSAMKSFRNILPENEIHIRLKRWWYSDFSWVGENFPFKAVSRSRNCCIYLCCIKRSSSEKYITRCIASSTVAEIFKLSNFAAKFAHQAENLIAFRWNFKATAVIATFLMNQWNFRLYFCPARFRLVLCKWCCN